jgi:putative transposase
MENQQNKNSPKTYSPSYTFTPVGQWEEGAIRTRKLRIYPNADQRKVLKEWIGTARFIYNKALEHVKKQPHTQVDVPKLTELFVGQYEVDSEMIQCPWIDDGLQCTTKCRASQMGCERHKPDNAPEKRPNPNIPGWTFETPKDIRKGSLWDLKAAFKAAFTNLKHGNIQRFNLGFKSKKSNPSIDIVKTAIKITDSGKLRLYPTYDLGEIKISKRQFKRDRVVIQADCRLQFKNGIWYLIVPVKTAPKPTKEPIHSVCALDPGVRTFQTLYSPEGVIKFQQNRELTQRLYARLDHFRSLRAKKEIRLSSYRRRQQRISRKLGWFVDHIHYSTIQELKAYKQILLPSFDSQEMVRERRLNTKTKRELLGLQHYTFKERLQSSLKSHPYSNVEIVTEEFTTKTCTQCGSLNTPDGDIYHCLSCSLVIDRDINGARNILLKYLITI